VTPGRPVSRRAAPLPADRRAESTPAIPAEIAMSRDELRSILSAIECAYEAAWHLADIGRLDFGAFQGLPRALAILRRHRDKVAA
jgi:hypothetical protein